MKTKIFIGVLFLIVSSLSNAQTIHWITFADTQDIDNGDEVTNSVDAFTSQFVDRINDAIIPKGYFQRQKTYSGSSFTKSKCLSVIRNLSVSNSDIIVFYYLGHGGRYQQSTANKQTAYNYKYPWPDLMFEVEEGDPIHAPLTLNQIHKLLKQKGARLTVTIGMCCNEENSQYKTEHGRESYSRRYKIVSKKFAKKFGQQLFLKYKGDIIIASSHPGQISYGGAEYGGCDVDCFTTALCETVDRYANNGQGINVTWNSFLNEVSSRCEVLAKNACMKSGRHYKGQTPKKEVNATLIKQ